MVEASPKGKESWPWVVVAFVVAVIVVVAVSAVYHLNPSISPIPAVRDSNGDGVPDSIDLWEIATPSNALASTLTGLWGEFRDLEIDSARSRLYVSDASRFNEHGVAVVDLDTHLEVARIGLDNPSGLTLSPGGDKLAVGSRDGWVYVVDPETFDVLGSVFIWETEYVPAQAWDLAFDGENRLLVTLTVPRTRGGGVFPVIVLDLVTMSEEARFSDEPWGFDANAVVRVDETSRRAYIVNLGRIWVYDLDQSPPAKIFDRKDPNFTWSMVLSPDGTQLYFSSGKVYDALDLTFLADSGHTGDVFINEVGGYIYYAKGPAIDCVRLSDYTRLARYAFRGEVPEVVYAERMLRMIAVDSVQEVAYVISGTIENDRTLHAVPLVTGFVDPYPPGGAIKRRLGGVSAILSGNADPAEVLMEVNGEVVVSDYDPDTMAVFHLRTPWDDGIHDVIITGSDETGRNLRLSWNFTVDTQPPEIYLDNADVVFRSPQATLRGRIVDATPVEASGNGQPLEIDLVDGSFEVIMELTEGGNTLVVTARDAVFNENSSYFIILYVPPTARHSDADAMFSIEYPTSWSLETDIPVNDVRVEVLITSPVIGPVKSNLNVITVSSLPEYSESALLEAAESALGNISRLASFESLDSPHLVEMDELLGVTYSFNWDSGGTLIFQRQYIVASDEVQMVWILTFTSSKETSAQYDPLFHWIAGSIRGETVANQPPICTIISPVEGQTVSGPITVTGTAFDPDSDAEIEKVEVRVDSGIWRSATGTTTWSYEWDTASAANGQHTIHVRAFDGNVYSTEVSVVVTVLNEGEGDDGGEDGFLFFRIGVEGVIAATILILLLVAIAAGVLVKRRRSRPPPR